MAKTIDELNKEIESFPENGEVSQLSKLYVERGDLFYDHGNFEACLEDSKKAVELDNNYDAYRNMGWVYRRLNKYAESMSVAEEMIRLNSERTGGYLLRAELNYATGKYDTIHEDFDKAIALNPVEPAVYNNRANYYADVIGDYDKALADYKKAIELREEYNAPNSWLADSYKNLGITYLENLKQYELASNAFNKAKEVAVANNNTYLLKTIDSNIEKAEALLSEAIRPNEKIKKLTDLIKASEIEKSIKETKESFHSFIQEDLHDVADNGLKFVVLRKWNSYTPIIADNRNISKGGGYFLKVDGKGIVIDPGFNFIDNFKSAGYKFKEIDTILISHAHNDHVADLESILTLLHEYNENIMGDVFSRKEGTIIELAYKEKQEQIFSKYSEKEIEERKEDIMEEVRKEAEISAKETFKVSPRRKRIEIYMSASTFMKYSPMLKLKSNENYSITIIKAGDKIPVSSDISLEISAIKAKHDDLISDCESMGFCIKYDKFLLLYTGDTGFSEEIETSYKNIINEYKARGEVEKIVLLAHLGGFKDYENLFNFSKSAKENSKYFYKNHLGRLGLAKLAEAVKPRLCIISEFGEEFRTTRKILADIFNEVYKDDTFFIPGDVGLCINDKSQIELINDIDWDIEKSELGFYDYTELEILDRHSDSSLHYIKKGLNDKGAVTKHLKQQYENKLKI